VSLADEQSLSPGCRTPSLDDGRSCCSNVEVYDPMSVADRPLGDAVSTRESAFAATLFGGSAEPAAVPIVTRISPARGWQGINLGELWQFRELIYFLSWRDVKVRYKQTMLGAAWAILQPVLMMVVFSVVFGRMAGVSSGGRPYMLFAYAGLLPWSFFATAIVAAGNSVVGSERLITKIYFPRLAVPLAAVGAAVVDFVIALGLLVAMMIYYRVALSPVFLLVPVVFLSIALAALGIGMLLAALNVAYRDFRYVIPFMVQLWMFATPTIYMQPKTTSTGWMHLVLTLNPMSTLIAAFRSAALGGSIAWGQLGIAWAVVGLVFLLGGLYFRKVEDGFADIV
jgi:lipopolysaccharide transport system permease protein